MDRNDRMDDLNDTSTRRSTTDDVLRHDEPASTGDEVGEAVGGISGVLTGAALGSLGGPIGTIIGGVAGAVSGWWAGRAISEAASHITDDDDSAYRTHYESSSSRLADRSYDDVRPAYQLGHLAGRNPEYAGREFEDVERDLQHGWTNDVSTKHGDWQSVRGYARDAYSRGRTGMSGGAAASTAAGAAAYGAGRTADNIDSTTDRAGDKMENAADRTGNALENAWDKTKQGASNLGDKIERGVDNLKDRVDGNPASRPGLDSTDSRAGFGGSGTSNTGMSDSGSAFGGAADRATNTGPLDRLADKADNVKDRVDGNPNSRPGPDATDRNI